MPYPVDFAIIMALLEMIANDYKNLTAESASSRFASVSSEEFSTSSIPEEWEKFFSEFGKQAEIQKERIKNDPRFQRPVIDDSDSVYDYCDTRGIAGYWTGGLK